MNIAITFASLSGNTITVANHIQSILESKTHAVKMFDALDVKADQLKHFDRVFMGGSTYGDGDLNPILEMFFDAANTDHHVCDHTKFAIFALGDSSYPKFAESGKLMEEKLQSMEACILQPVLTLDGDPDDEMLKRVEEWVGEIVKKSTNTISQ